MPQLRFISQLAAPADRVWAHATSPSGINRELSPVMKMTFPAGIDALSEDTVRVGEPICKSWFLMFRFLPIDRAVVTLAEIGPGRRFVEQSPLSSMRLWRHTRTVSESGTGSTIEDVLDFEPRGPVPQALSEWFVRRIFEHRHARLRETFG